MSEVTRRLFLSILASAGGAGTAFAQRRWRKSAGVSGGGGGGDEGTGGSDLTPTIGMQPSELAAHRTRLATYEKETYQAHLDRLGTVLSTTTFPHATDAGGLVIALATIAVLDPENVTMSANFTFNSIFNTAQKAADYAMYVANTSLYHGSSTSSRTCIGNVDQITTSNRNRPDGSGTPHQLKQGNPSLSVFPCYLLWDYCRTFFASGTNTYSGGTRTTEFATLQTSLVTAATNALSTVTHVYPNWDDQTACIMNQTMITNRFLSSIGTYPMVGESVLGASESLIDAGIQNIWRRNNDELEYWYSTADGIGGCIHEDWAGAYSQDNVIALAFAALAGIHVPGVGDSVGLSQFLKGYAQHLLKSIFPSTRGESRVYCPHWGTTNNFYGSLNDLGENVWMVIVALRRLGHTTEANQLLWLLQSGYLGINLTTVGSVSPQSLPSEIVTNSKKIWWPWHIVWGGAGNLTPSAITSISTRKASFGHLIYTNVLTNKADGTHINFNAQEVGLYGHYDYSQSGQWTLFTHGAFLKLASMGNNKGAFGVEIKGDGQSANGSGIGLINIGTNGYPITANNASYTNNGTRGGGIAANPAISHWQNTGQIEGIIGDQYAADPDAASHMYVGYQTLTWGSGSLTTGQQEFIAIPGSNLVVEFVRITPQNTSQEKAVYRWPSPVRITSQDGTETATADGCQTFNSTSILNITNDSNGNFTATHNGVTQTWPDAHGKAFVKVLSPDPFTHRYRGYDATYEAALRAGTGAFRSNLEVQAGNDTFGRNNKCRYNANQQLVANGSNNVVTLNDGQDIQATDVQICLALTANSTPIYRNITAYDNGANTVTLSGGTIAAGTYNYSILDNASNNSERAYNWGTGSYDETNGNNVRRLLGHGRYELIWDDPQPTNSYVLFGWQYGDADTLSSPATATAITDTDVYGVDYGSPVNQIVLFKKVAPDRTTDAAWLGASTFTFDTPFSNDRTVRILNMKAGSTYLVTIAVQGAGYRVTVNPAGGARTVTSGKGVLQFNITSGAIV